jgi:hypothetical protein
MVFFSCDGCGEMLKKSQVDGHANRCRRCDSVSCVDCSVSFWGGTYIISTLGLFTHRIKPRILVSSEISVPFLS